MVSEARRGGGRRRGKNENNHTLLGRVRVPAPLEHARRKEKRGKPSKRRRGKGARGRHRPGPARIEAEPRGKLWERVRARCARKKHDAHLQRELERVGDGPEPPSLLHSRDLLCVHRRGGIGDLEEVRGDHRGVQVDGGVVHGVPRGEVVEGRARSDGYATAGCRAPRLERRGGTSQGEEAPRGTSDGGRGDRGAGERRDGTGGDRHGSDAREEPETMDGGRDASERDVLGVALRSM